MIIPRRRIIIGLSALALVAPLFTVSGCKPKAQSTPTPFTAQLTELEGVQAVFTLRHPKQTLGDLDKLMTEVPETSLLRMFMGSLSPYGYPEFSELDAGSNIGIALLEAPLADWEAGKLTVVGFAQLKEGGKIWTALTQKGLVLQQRGSWTWIAKDAASFDLVKAPAALTDFIARPQSEELRTWARLSPTMLKPLHDKLFPLIAEKLTARPADEQKALLAYAEIAWGYFAQLHSGSSALDVNEHGIALKGTYQFLPETALGTLLRYPSAPVAPITQALSADGLVRMVVRSNPHAQSVFINGVLDGLIAVDYPPFAESLKQTKASYNIFAQHSDGSAAMDMDMAMPMGNQPPVIKMVGLASGNFTAEQASAYYRGNMAGTEKLTNAIFATAKTFAPAMPLPEMRSELKENVLTIDGTRFSSIVTKTSTAGAEQTTTVLYGVVDGTIVYAMDETSLRAKLPALRAGKPVPSATPLIPQGDEQALMTVQGERVVQLVADAAQIDAADADIAAQLTTLKSGYTAAGPVRIVLSASQAQCTMTLTIPYKFIAQSVKLGQFAQANAKKPAKK